MEIKTIELSGAALDWAVAKAEGATDLRYDTVACWWFTLDGEDRVLSRGWSAVQNFAPSTVWSQGGPIIEREGISVDRMGIAWTADIADSVGGYIKRTESGPTPLIAAMRCYVASKLGDEIDIPRELIK